MTSLELEQKTQLKSDLMGTLIKRGCNYDIADTVIARAKYPFKQIEQEDGTDVLAQLSTQKGLTFAKDQNLVFLQNQLKEEEADDIFQPLNMKLCVFKVPSQFDICLDMLQPPETYDVKLGKQMRVEQWADAKPYQRVETELLLTKSMKTLVYHRNIANAMPKLTPFPTLKGLGKFSDCLKFEARFPSGNLFSAHRLLGCSQEIYELFLTPDTSTSNHMQWFYFAISNVKKGVRYQFKITNILKQYEEPFQPMVYTDAWHRMGENVASYHNVVQRMNVNFYQSAMLHEESRTSNRDVIMKSPEYEAAQQKFKVYLKKQGGIYTKKVIQKQNFTFTAPGNYNTYAFEIVFDKDYECVYIAKDLPYYYQNMIRMITDMEAQTKLLKSQLKVQPLQFARSYLGNQIPLLKVTNDKEEGKDIIMVQGRIRSSDNASSWCVQGFFNQLLGFNDRFIIAKLEEAMQRGDMMRVQELKQELQQERDSRNYLLNKFVFYVIPMVNVDGVGVGSGRTNYFGLNHNHEYNRSQGTYKLPFIASYYRLHEKLQQKNRKVFWSYVFQGQQAATSWNLDGILLEKYEDLKSHIWFILGTLGVIPLINVDVQNRLLMDMNSMKTFMTQGKNMDTMNSDYYIERPNVKQLLDEFGEMLEKHLVKEEFENYFEEFVLIRKMDEYPDFDSSLCTLTEEKNVEKVNTPRLIIQKHFGCRYSYNVAIPDCGNQSEYYSIQDYYDNSASLFKLIQWRFTGDMHEALEKQAQISDEYQRWMRTTVLSLLGKQQLKVLDVVKLPPSVQTDLPAKVVQFAANRQDKARFEPFWKVEEYFNVRFALEINEDEQNYSDSDNSVQDADLAPQLIGKKMTAAEKASMKQSIAVWAAAFPKLPKKKKSKKGAKKGVK